MLKSTPHFDLHSDGSLNIHRIIYMNKRIEVWEDAEGRDYYIQEGNTRNQSSALEEVCKKIQESIAKG